MQDKEYIAYKAVMAIRNVLTNTFAFIEPKASLDVMETYRIENSSVLSWLYSEGVMDKLLKDTITTSYANYKLWCELNSYKAVGSSRMSQEVCNELSYTIENDKFIDKSVQE